MMNKEEIHLLKIKLFLNYYKKDITDDYIRCVDNIVLDNKVLNSMDERLYITTLENYINLEKENKRLKELLGGKE